MKSLLLALLLPVVALAQTLTKDVPYLPDGHARHVLDIHAPASAKGLPVVFWIHGGGWQAGDKSLVDTKPAWFNAQGFIFVATNYRLLPEVEMDVLTRDVASAFAWVHQNIAKHGGDPQRILVGGHSAGAQLAALLCTDDRYLKAHGIGFDCLTGCIPVDGDTYDIPAIIETAETRRRVHHQPQPKFGHREKFMHSAEKHLDFSAVTHIAKGKEIPPFLILHVASHPDTSAQAMRLQQVLKAAEIPVTVHAGKNTDHVKQNHDLGLNDDPGTVAISAFLKTLR